MIPQDERKQLTGRIYDMRTVLQGENFFDYRKEFLMIHCPRCGENYVHLDTTETVKDHDDYCAGWGGRGDLTLLSFWAECGSTFALCFGSHKGTTAVFVRETNSCLLPEASYDSPLESLFHKTWWAHPDIESDGWFPLVYQYPINEGAFRLDFACPPLKVGIELDGYTYHRERDVFNKDRWRQRQIEALGWQLIRFSGDELRANPTSCVNDVVARFTLVRTQQKGG